MVEARTEQGEVEHPGLYALEDSEAPIVDTALEDEERVDAEHNLRAAFLQAHELDDVALAHQ